MRYSLIKLEPEVIRVLSTKERASLKSRFPTEEKTPRFPLGPGDVVVITIFEASAAASLPSDGSSGRGGSVTLPPQTIASDGLITVPYAGSIKATGRTVQELQAQVEKALLGRVAAPQVVLSLQTGRSNAVTVVGDVSLPGVFPLTANGERLLDMIAIAGGAKGTVRDTTVRLTRRGETATISLAAIVSAPAENLPVEPGDIVFVSREPRLYTAIGSAGRAGNFPIDRDRLSLIQAIGAASGLDGDKATPSGIFLYRKEPVATLSMLGIDGGGDHAQDGGFAPVIYQLDLRDPDGILLAQEMLVEADDVIYVAEAAAASLFKFLRILGAGTSLVSTPVNLTR